MANGISKYTSRTHRNGGCLCSKIQESNKQSRDRKLVTRTNASYGLCSRIMIRISNNNQWLKPGRPDRKSTRLNSCHGSISYAVFCLKKKKKKNNRTILRRKKKLRQIL